MSPTARNEAIRAPQQERSRATRARVLDAAEQEVAEVGVARAGTRAIARRAGLSVGALYRYFPDKDAVLDALALRYLDHVRTSYGAVLEEMPPGPVADVGGALRSAVELLVRRAGELQQTHPGYYRLTEELPPDRPDSPAHQVRTELVERFVRAWAQVSGGEPDDAREAVALSVETVRHALVGAPAEGPARERLLAELTTMVAAYLAVRAGRARRVDV